MCLVGAVAAVINAIAFEPRTDTTRIGLAEESVIVACVGHVAIALVVFFGTLSIAIAQPFIRETNIRIVTTVLSWSTFGFAVQSYFVQIRWANRFAIAQDLSRDAQPAAVFVRTHKRCSASFTEFLV